MTQSALSEKDGVDAISDSIRTLAPTLPAGGVDGGTARLESRADGAWLGVRDCGVFLRYLGGWRMALKRFVRDCRGITAAVVRRSRSLLRRELQTLRLMAHGAC